MDPETTTPRLLSGWLGRLADGCARDAPAAPGDWLTRFVILRLLGLVYLMAFLTLLEQGPALLGPRGLLPLGDHLEAVASELGSRAAGFRALPSIFWWGSGMTALRAAGVVGVVLSAAVLLGYANALILSVLCALQISISNVGQTFYGFGWELQLVETGFLCIFLGSSRCSTGALFSRRPPGSVVIWLLRHGSRRALCVGAGLIKLRGDFVLARPGPASTFTSRRKPIPSPLSAYFHALPPWAHACGVGLQPRRRARRAVPPLRGAPGARAPRAPSLWQRCSSSSSSAATWRSWNWLTLVGGRLPIALRVLRRRRLGPRAAALSARGPARRRRAASRRRRARRAPSSRASGALVAILSVSPGRWNLVLGGRRR